MTQTAMGDPFDDLAERVRRLEQGAASRPVVDGLFEQIQSLEARVRILERATPIADPTPKPKSGRPIIRSGAPIDPNFDWDDDIETLRRMAQGGRPFSIDGKLLWIMDKLEAIERRMTSM